MPSRSLPTTMFGGDSVARTIAMSASEAAPVIDEAAILFALGEMGPVEELLRHAIGDASCAGDGRIAWAMLFDLYQVLDRRMQFDDLSIAYANAFETSPPAWIDLPHPPPRQLHGGGKTPAIAFAGRLDGSILPQLQQIQALATGKGSLRLEFTRVTEIDPQGCELLLRALQNLPSEHELVLVGAQELNGRLRQYVQAGRRTDASAPWLLLLEILRLLNREKEFEDCSIDYCVTFEVSPPTFVSPRQKVTTASAGAADAGSTATEFTMPAVIAEHCDSLLLTIESYVKSHDPAILDCAHLTRIDFNAANQLLGRLQPLAASGMRIRLQQVNHLVTALLRVIGLHEIVQIETRKI